MAGLRELKKERTRAAIQGEALRLIAEQGYDATTCEQIAAAAEVSPATLFRYFATKEDIVLQDMYDPMIADAVRSRPRAEAPLTAVRRAFTAAMSRVYEADLETIRQRTALMLSVPALRARSFEQQESLVAVLADTLGERVGRPGHDLRVRAAASALASAVAAAVEHWAVEGGDLPRHVDEALESLAHLTTRSL
jgi:AcrR family transcriptional regulator